MNAEEFCPVCQDTYPVIVQEFDWGCCILCSNCKRTLETIYDDEDDDA